MASKVEFELRGDKLPPDVRPLRYDCREGMSLPFELSVDFATEDVDFDPRAVLRTSVTLVVRDDERGRARITSGVCDRIELRGHDGTHLVYRARMRPPVAALAHREDCRIYQDQSIVDVVKAVFAAAGVDKTEWRLGAGYPPREYVVQYRESELDFVHRLLEEEGIFYFFEHVDGEVTMILADGVQALDGETLPPTVLTLAQGLLGTDPVEDVRLVKRLRPNLAHLRDFDFERPQQKPESSVPTDGAWPLAHYEYPGGFTNEVDGGRRTTQLLRSLRRDAAEIVGSSRSPVLEVGKGVTVVGASQAAIDGRYVITSLRSRGTQALTGQAGDGASVENEYRAVPDGQAWAPPRTTRRPRIHGLQTAVVTGPTQGEEEIHVDKYGRVKVRFRWDRVGQFDDKSSCWLRVEQLPLGGSLIFPRVGWEVSVAFLDGDPDRPFVTSRLYNAERTPPYALPGAKASGALKSSSSPGGAGHNELKLGDSGGGQSFDVHAQKDLNITVGHDQNEKVGVDSKHVVKVNRNQQVAVDRKVTIGGSQTLDVGALASTKVGGNLSISVGGNETANATSNHVDKVGGDRSYAVGANMTTIQNGIASNVDGDLSREVGAVMMTASIASITSEVGGSVTENIGVAKIDASKGPWAETVGGSKTATYVGADLRLVKGSSSASSDASVTQLTGGLAYAKVAGDYVVKAPMISLVGATGTFKGGGSELKLGGGPIVLKGSTVKIETALLVKLGSSLTMGS